MRNVATVVSALLIGLSAHGQSSEGGLHQRAAAIKPRPEEIKWQTVPWVMDLAEGYRQARTENRLLFLWATAGPTLERC